jgi:hypothetical protein
MEGWNASERAAGSMAVSGAKQRSCLVVLLACGGCYDVHPDAELHAAVPDGAAAHAAAPAPELDSASVPAAVDASSSAAPDTASTPAAPSETATSSHGGGKQRRAALTTPRLTAPDPNLRVAFLGDQGIGAGALAVLQLIADEDADAVVHVGDLGYATGVGSVEAWEAQLDSVLGPRFPYFVAIGNHDVPDWSTAGGYREVLLARLARTRGASCEGEYGVNALCRFRGLTFVVSGIGTQGDGHEAFLDEALAERDAIWRLCVWHKNQHDMQVGGKPDEVGWLAYRTCAAHGVPIITGHEHSYSRTFALLDVGNRALHHGAAFDAFDIALEPGSTMVVVSGLGGKNARAFTADHADDTWWAAIHARDLQLRDGMVAGTEPDVEPGALLIDFHVDGDPHLARGYFKTVAGEVVDDFELTTH